jgi:hypothetical protein
MICEHVEEIRDVEPSNDGCLECLQTGDERVHLRLCLYVRSRRMLRHVQWSSRSNLVKIGAGAMSIRLCWLSSVLASRAEVDGRAPADAN